MYTPQLSPIYVMYIQEQTTPNKVQEERRTTQCKQTTRNTNKTKNKTLRDMITASVTILCLGEERKINTTKQNESVGELSEVMDSGECLLGLSPPPSTSH